MQDDNGLSRRRYPRVKVNMKVEYRKEDELFSDYLLNISQGGVFIQSENPLSADTELDIQFVLPGFEREINVSGKVMWVNLSDPDDPFPPGMGIMFTNIEEGDRSILKDYIQSHMEMSREKEDS